MTELLTPGELLRLIYDEQFGFLPTNASMKPVHVANGLMRRIVGVTTDHTPLARVLRQYVENQRGGYQEERNPNAAILEDYGACFLDRDGNVPSDEALTRFRSLAKDTLGADDAVYPSQASFTLSHRRMITSDLSDNGLGDFLAAFLMCGSPRKTPHAAQCLGSLVSTDSDPWTMVGWPLLQLGAEREAGLGQAAQTRAERSASLLEVDGNGEFLSPTLRELRKRYEQLATYEASRGSKLATLRRLVLFGVFGVHVHMIRRCGDVDAASAQPPILLDLFDGQRQSLREASAATLQAGFRGIERLVLACIRDHLSDACDSQAEEYLARMPETAENALLCSEYEAQLAGAEPMDALAEAFWKIGYAGVGPGERKGLPWNSLLELGRRSGYLMPYDNRGRGGKEHKRYGLNAEFAEVLVASTVAPGNPLDFDDFLDQLRESFGLVIGRVTDFEAIRRNDLRLGEMVSRSVSVNEADLRANLNAFRDLIRDIGFAKSYADGRTVVTTDGVWHAGT